MESEDTKLYQDLGIEPTQVDVLTLSEKDIARFYRKAALKWHPDKNQDNPKAAARFSKIFVAYETLTVPVRRKEYDAAIRAARAQRKRFEQLDAGRRRMKEDLRKREQAADSLGMRSTNLDESTLKRMQREIERLRREAAREEDGLLRRNTGKSTQTVETEVGGGQWESVKGYEQYKSISVGELDFAQYEKAVLGGYFAE